MNRLWLKRPDRVSCLASWIKALFLAAPAGHVLCGADQPVRYVARPSTNEPRTMTILVSPSGPDDAVLACERVLRRDRVAHDLGIGVAVVGVDQRAQVLDRGLEALARDAMDPVEALGPARPLRGGLVLPGAVVG